MPKNIPKLKGEGMKNREKPKRRKKSHEKHHILGTGGRGFGHLSFKFITNLEPLENGRKNADKYAKMGTKIAENLNFFLLKPEGRGGRTVKNHKRRKKSQQKRHILG